MHRSPCPVDPATVTLRWIARVWSVASVSLLLFFVVGEGIHPTSPAATEWLVLLLFPVGVAVGMIVAWWREGLGGAVTVVSLVLFYLLTGVLGRFPRGGWFLAFSAPGFLFLGCALAARFRRKTTG